MNVWLYQACAGQEDRKLCYRAHTTQINCRSALHQMNHRCLLQAIDKLSGKWKLVYTASSELTGLLGLNRVPGVEVGDITQTINAYTLSALNTVSIQGFGSRTSVSAKAALEVQSPKRVQVGLVSVPQR